MVLLKFQDALLDLDLQLLVQLLAVIDDEIIKIDAAIADSPDPDGDGWFERGDGLYGLGFVACQQYLNVTYPGFGFSKADRPEAIKKGPKYLGALSYAQVIDAAANFWKHQGEWDGTRGQEKNTRAVLENVFPSSKDWVMANVLHALLLKPKATRLANIVTWLEKWRDALSST